jgi:hypothetical protein
MIRYDVGNVATAVVVMAVPAVAIALLWLTVVVRRDVYRRRYRGWRLFWEAAGSTLLISLVLAGLFFWYLFWRPFYTITVAPDGGWTLGYILPKREVQLTAPEVATLALREDRLPFLRKRWQPRYLALVTTGGRTYYGAPMDGKRAGLLMTQLRR